MQLHEPIQFSDTESVSHQIQGKVSCCTLDTASTHSSLADLRRPTSASENVVKTLTSYAYERTNGVLRFWCRQLSLYKWYTDQQLTCVELYRIWQLGRWRQQQCELVSFGSLCKTQASSRLHHRHHRDWRVHKSNKLRLIKWKTALIIKHYKRNVELSIVESSSVSNTSGC